MTSAWHCGRIVAGHGVASGRDPGSPYPLGTIAMQQPFFMARGLDLSDCWQGTLNLAFDPLEVVLNDADFTFPMVRWTDRHPPETFSFWRVEIHSSSSEPTAGWIYQPHAETKQRHWQPATVIELLAPRVDGLTTGSELFIRDLKDRIRLIDGVRLRARLLEALKFRVLASQQDFFDDNGRSTRRSWLSSHHPEALVLPDHHLDKVWQQAKDLYTEL